MKVKALQDIKKFIKHNFLGYNYCIECKKECKGHWYCKDCYRLWQKIERGRAESLDKYAIRVGKQIVKSPIRKISKEREESYLCSAFFFVTSMYPSKLKCLKREIGFDQRKKQRIVVREFEN